MVNYYAGAAEAAGRRTADIDLGDLIAAELVGNLPEGNARHAKVLTCCTLLVDGLARHDLGQRLPDDSRIDVLPRSPAADLTDGG